jgi:hypothetical protein
VRVLICARAFAPMRANGFDDSSLPFRVRRERWGPSAIPPLRTDWSFV